MLENIEQRRGTRKQIKDAFEHIQENKQGMLDLHSDKFRNMYAEFQEASKDAVHTRELQYDASCIKELSCAVKGQAESLCDLSGRFRFEDIVTEMKRLFGNENKIGIDWLSFGKQAKVIFTSAPEMNTMVGSMQKEERVRKVATRKAKSQEIEAGNATAQEIINTEEDGNDEATNARVSRLFKHIEGENGEFDLLRLLINPADPVQSVENFFDYAYLHKVRPSNKFRSCIQCIKLPHYNYYFYCTGENGITYH